MHQLKQDIQVNNLNFLFEQEGVPEKESKNLLCSHFDNNKVDIFKAYLARVTYNYNASSAGQRYLL